MRPLLFLLALLKGSLFGAITLADLPDEQPEKIEQSLLKAFHDHLRGHHATAATTFRKLSDNGNARATYLLALCHLNGEGVAASESKAIELLRKAAKEDHHPARVRLACLLMASPDTLKEGKKELEAAVEAANPDALFAKGVFLATGQIYQKDPEKAYQLLWRAAESGHAEAPVALASLLPVALIEQHRDVLLPSLQRQVRRNKAPAHTAMGYCFALGLMGVPLDPGMAFRQFLKGVRGGHRTAFHEVALCYRKGLGVAPDPDRAHSWMIQAALRGEPRAAETLSAEAEDPIAKLAWALLGSTPRLATIRRNLIEKHSDDLLAKARLFLKEVRHVN